MSYSEDRADSRSLTAVVLVILGIAVVALIFYFAVYAPSRSGPETVIVQPSAAPGPAGAPGAPGATGTQGATGGTGATGAPGVQGDPGDPGTPPPTDPPGSGGG